MGSIGASGPVLTQLLDDQAYQTPDQIYCIHPVSQDSDHGWHRISIKQMSEAVDRLSWWIQEKIPAGEPQLLAYIGTNDLRYGAFILACMKTGHAALLLSTRNSLLANQHLLRSTNCSVLVDGSERKTLCNLINELEGSCPEVERWHIGPIWDVFSSESVKPYVQNESYEILENRTAVVIHSSGTTGLPKPVRLTHGYLATLFYMQTLPLPEGRETTQLFIRQKGQLRIMTGPLFHFIGLVCISECIFYRTPFLLAPDRPLTVDLFSQIMSLDTPPKWGLIAPFVLEELSASEKGRNALSKLSALNFGGAPLSQTAGDTISKLVPLQPLYGSSEAAYTANLQCQDPADWNYLEWNPAVGTQMDDVGDGLCELVLPRGETRRFKGIFHTKPHLTEFRTGDLFREHPTKPGLWKYQGRGDDIIVLNNGEKFNPTDAEKLIETHALVNHAAILGQDRFQAALLIEPHWRDLPKDWNLEWLHRTLRPMVDQANAVLPGHGKLFYSHVAFATEDKPFALSPKGTMRRREIAKMYQSLIDALYTAHSGAPPSGAPQPVAQLPTLQGFGLEEIEQWIRDIIAHILSLENVDLDDGIVALGMDSLQLVRLVQVLQDTTNGMEGLTHRRIWTSAFIYQLETSRKIAQSFCDQVNKTTSDEESNKNALTREDVLKKYTWEQARYLDSGGAEVILTGSTGELGSFMLNKLLQDPSITRIVCLNRSADAAERQIQTFRQKKLSSFWLTETTRVEFKQSRLHDPYLGLGPDEYNALQQDISIIIHNAWPVNFNQSLASFEPHLAGVRRLLNFAAQSAREPEFHFISSVSTVTGQSLILGDRILEKRQGVSCVLPQGYGESKYIAERLCEISSKRTGAKIAIHRVGQLGGPSNSAAGMWNTRDWFPSLIKSSLTMQMLPDNLGPMPVDWLAIDTAANIISEIIGTRRANQPPPLTVYHITNPNAVAWKEIAPLFANACKAEIVTLDVWVNKVKERAFGSEPNGNDLQDLPATQLLDFFAMLLDGAGQAQPCIDTSNARKDSATLSELGPVDSRMVNIWLNQWKDWLPGLDAGALEGST
ncbi:NRPS-like enzyme [Penicillium brevicompactum]|uniref:NRPS-like enzyme n=1 Tax=Penicillium brevicompactum TaxID=5074 RepID=A0A9W9Q202_PENBR|nr:NRPS-like enzyme [Penicillium brevicompactum]